MEPIPALSGIAAKLVAITDVALDTFVTVSIRAVDACGFPELSSNLTDTGEALVPNLVAMLWGVVNYLAGQLTGLAVLSA